MPLTSTPKTQQTSWINMNSLDEGYIDFGWYHGPDNRSTEVHLQVAALPKDIKAGILNRLRAELRSLPPIVKRKK